MIEEIDYTFEWDEINKDIFHVIITQKYQNELILDKINFDDFYEFFHKAIDCGIDKEFYKNRIEKIHKMNDTIFTPMFEILDVFDEKINKIINNPEINKDIAFGIYQGYELGKELYYTHIENSY
ncbi:MAG: hypothetical protein LBM96_05860 [Methanobrevibacter sp.]|jgi:hypothetical protein|nr:hypothetical protein [Candidatus Methanoflexus mossambicus]